MEIQVQQEKAHPQQQVIQDVEREGSDSFSFIIHQAVQTVVDSFLSQFESARIFEIKKLSKLTNKVVSLAFAVVQKSKHRHEHALLSANQSLIAVNVLLVLLRRELVGLEPPAKGGNPDYQIEHRVGPETSK
jgi:UTP-glucose-1-phosphate uridylyltransferase